MTKFTIELGEEVKSSISGFKGIVTSRAEHLNGCNRYWVAPTVKKDGTLPEGMWMDEPELVVTKKKKVKKIKKSKSGPGGFPSKIK